MHYSIVKNVQTIFVSGLHFTRRRFELSADRLLWRNQCSPGPNRFHQIELHRYHHLDSMVGQPGRLEGFLCLTLSDLLASLGVEPGGSTLVIECKPEYQAV
jgi:hypothetical protein